MSLSFYSKENLLAFNKEYFANPPQGQPGIARHVVGKVLADQRALVSWFVVRRSMRGKTQCWAIQHVKQDHPGERRPRTYYETKTTDYCVVHIDWDTCHITELDAFPSSREAAHKQKELHAAACRGVPGSK